MIPKLQSSMKQENSESNTSNNFWLNSPVRAVLYLTNQCDFCCNHCYSYNFKFQELCQQDWFKIIDKLSLMGVFEIVFLGGEPFFRQDFLDIAYYAKEKGFGLKISTNAAKINKANLPHLKQLFNGTIQVSLDSSSKEINDAIRGEGSFGRTVGGIEKLLEESIDFSIGMVVNKINCQSVKEMYSFCKERGIKGVHYMRVMPKGRAMGAWNILNLTNQEYALAVREVRSMADSRPLLQIDGTYEYREDLESLGRCMTGCEAGRYELTILSDGKIVPCDMFENLVLGNAVKDDLSSIWLNNPFLNTFRTAKKKIRGNCGLCKIDYCSGCRGQAAAIKRDFYASDPFCIREEMMQQ